MGSSYFIFNAAALGFATRNARLETAFFRYAGPRRRFWFTGFAGGAQFLFSVRPKTATSEVRTLAGHGNLHVFRRYYRGPANGYAPGPPRRNRRCDQRSDWSGCRIGLLLFFGAVATKFLSF